MSYTYSKKRMVKNTAFLYVRTLILLVIGIFTSRITLQALGVTGYGTINVVSGFVGMFSIISGSLIGASQRFLTYEMGARNYEIREVFNASLKIHIVLALLLLLIAETIGLYFVNNNLNIPIKDISAVQWVYQCSIMATLLSLFNIPYNALIISYERMNVFAYFSLIEGVLKFFVVFLLLYISGNKLIIYSILTFTSAILMCICYQMYVRKHFKRDVKFKLKTNKDLFKCIFRFAGWTFLGNSATICSNQGVNIVINIFCGVVVNAARGIAVMIEGVTTTFVNNFTTALNPQITKSYATNQHEQLIELIGIGLRVTVFLMLIILVPVVYASNELLEIWFTEVPKYAPQFVSLTLIVAFIQAVGNPFLTLLLASGKIRNYQIFSGTLSFLNLPGSYLLLRWGMSPMSVYFLAIAISAVIFLGRLIFIHKTLPILLTPVYKNATKLIPVLILTFALNYMIYISISIDTFLRLVLFGISTTFVTLCLILIFGISRNERMMVISRLRKIR